MPTLSTQRTIDPCEARRIALEILERAEKGRQPQEDFRARPPKHRGRFGQWVRYVRVRLRRAVGKLMWRLLHPELHARLLDATNPRITPRRLYEAYPYRDDLQFTHFPEHLTDWMAEVERCGDPLFVYLVQELAWCAADRQSCVIRLATMLVDVLNTADGLGLLDDVLRDLVEFGLDDQSLHFVTTLCLQERSKEAGQKQETGVLKDYLGVPAAKDAQKGSDHPEGVEACGG